MFAQDTEPYTIKGQVLNAANDKPLFNANIININKVKGTVSNKKDDLIFKLLSMTLYIFLT